MTFNLKRLTALFRHSEVRPRNPERDWARLLGLAALVLVLLVGWHVWAFETVVNGGVLGPRGKVEAPSASISALETVPALLEVRAAEDAKYVIGEYRFADPSL